MRFLPNILIILGIPFHRITLSETLQTIDEMISTGGSHYIATANLDFAARASRDVELQRILVDADLVLCDSTPFFWASSLLGMPFPERVAGADLVPHLFEYAEEKNYRIFLLGAKKDILQTAKQRVQQKYPKLQICGIYSPPYAPLLEMNHDEIISTIQKAKPHILLVAFGCPKQEKWIYMHYQKLGVACSIGVGATFDFLAGKFRRAPKWVQHLGLEWFFRLVQEPGRLFNRYLIDLFFFMITMWRQRSLLLAKTPPTFSCASNVSHDAYFTIVKWEGRIDVAAVKNAALDIVEQNVKETVLLDLSRVHFIDSSGVGHLLRVVKAYREKGKKCILYTPSSHVRTVLKMMNLDRLLEVVETLQQAKHLARPAALFDVLQSEPQGEDLRIILRQDLTAAQVEKLIVWVSEEWVYHASALKLVLDMKQVRFMDSSGLGFLLRCRKMVHLRGSASLQLDYVQPNVRNVIELAQLQNVLNLEFSS